MFNSNIRAKTLANIDMRYLKILFLIICCNYSFGQVLTDSILVDAQLKTFQSYIHNSKYFHSDQYYFKKNKLSPDSIIYIQNYSMIFLESDKLLELIKKNKFTELYELTMDSISSDTIDINITGWSVDYEKKLFRKGEFQFRQWCGGSNGDIPDGRIVFEPTSRLWKFYSPNDVFNSQFKESVPTRKK